MREGLTESPLNPLPLAVWLLALPIIACEAVFALGQAGIIGGAQGVGMRLSAMQMTMASGRSSIAAMMDELSRASTLASSASRAFFIRLVRIRAVWSGSRRNVTSSGTMLSKRTSGWPCS